MDLGLSRRSAVHPESHTTTSDELTTVLTVCDSVISWTVQLVFRGPFFWWTKMSPVVTSSWTILYLEPEPGFIRQILAAGTITYIIYSAITTVLRVLISRTVRLKFNCWSHFDVNLNKRTHYWCLCWLLWSVLESSRTSPRPRGQFWSPWSWPWEPSPWPWPRDSSPWKNSRTHSSPVIALLYAVETGAKRLVGYTIWTLQVNALLLILILFRVAL